MAELTQEQIDELLGNVSSGEVDLNEIGNSNKKSVKEYDFRSPRKISKDQLKFLDNIYDNFSRFFGLQLSSLTRVGCQIEILQIEEGNYKEFNNALSDSVLVGVFDVDVPKNKPDENQILVEIARPLSFCILDLLLGGDGSGYNFEREYTDIELCIMEYLFKMMPPHLNSAWSNYIELRHNFDMIETNSRVIQFVEPDVAVAIVAMKMTLNDLEGNVNICIPASLLNIIFQMFDSRSGRTTKKDGVKAETQKEMIFGSIKKSSLPVKAILGSTDIALQDLLVLRKGDIVVLDKNKTNKSVKLKVDDMEWFSGEIGRTKKNYAVKIDGIISNDIKGGK